MSRAHSEYSKLYFCTGCGATEGLVVKKGEAPCACNSCGHRRDSPFPDLAALARGEGDRPREFEVNLGAIVGLALRYAAGKWIRQSLSVCADDGSKLATIIYHLRRHPGGSGS